MLRTIVYCSFLTSLGFAIACGPTKPTRDKAFRGDDDTLSTLFSPAESVEAPADVEAMIAMTGSACGAGFHLQGTLCISSVLTCRVVNARGELVGHGESRWDGTAWGPCSLNSCAPGFELSQDRCERAGTVDKPETPTSRSCTVYERNRVPIGAGTQQWEDRSWGRCKVESCYDGYRLEYQRCLSNRAACNIYDQVGGERVVIAAGFRIWRDGRWSSDCTFTSCAADYELKDGSCMPAVTERSCKLRDGDKEVGAGTQTWSGKSGWRRCAATSCVVGYHMERGYCRKDTEPCTLSDYASSGRLLRNVAQGQRTWVDGSWQDCRFESCPTGWSAEGGTCVPQVKGRACPVYEMGKPSRPRGDGARRWTATGSTGWSRCEVVRCHDGFHRFASYCQPNTRSCTARDEIDGKPTVIASGEAQWRDGRWQRCVFTQCLEGYRLEDGYCRPPQTTRDCDMLDGDTVVGQGTRHWSGTGWGHCKPTSCVDGYHPEHDYLCRPNEINCRLYASRKYAGFAQLGNGAIGEGTRKWDGERWGSCIPTSCAEGYVLSDNTCNPPETERACELRSREDVIGTGKQRWAEGGWSRCVADSCASGYHLERGWCLASVVDCTQRVYQDGHRLTVGQGTRSWSDGSWAACAFTSCIDGWKLDTGGCTPQQTTRACKVTLGRKVIGEGTQTWDRGRWGRCEPSSCSGAYHLYASSATYKSCRANTIRCDAYDRVDGKHVLVARGTRTWDGSAYGACVITFCKEGWEISDGSCNPPERERECQVLDRATVIGAGRQSWRGSSWGSCEATSCHAGYALHNRRCYPLSRQCPSYYGRSYSRAGTGTQRWKEGRYGPCEELTCLAGYELRGGACVPPGVVEPEPLADLGSKLQ